MLDDRAQTLLKTLIERYIAEGQPVGSRTLSKFSGLDLSPATIRNVMSDLEEMGFIASPHTSAGRVPTPRGYRFFVDTLLTVQPLQSSELSEMRGRHAARPAAARDQPRLAAAVAAHRTLPAWWCRRAASSRAFARSNSSACRTSASC